MRIITGPGLESKHSSGARIPDRVPAGRLVSAQAFNALRDYVAGFMAQISLVKHPLDLVHGTGGTGDPSDPRNRGWFFAQITTYESCGPNQWSYGFAEVKHEVGAGHATPWVVRSDGYLGTAHNLIEHMNSGVDVEGNGVDVTAMLDVAPGFALMPCPVSNIVVMFIYVNRITTGNGYWFQYENSVDGTCEAPA